MRDPPQSATNKPVRSRSKRLQGLRTKPRIAYMPHRSSSGLHSIYIERQLQMPIRIETDLENLEKRESSSELSIHLAYANIQSGHWSESASSHRRQVLIEADTTIQARASPNNSCSEISPLIALFASRAESKNLVPHPGIYKLTNLSNLDSWRSPKAPASEGDTRIQIVSIPTQQWAPSTQKN